MGMRDAGAELNQDPGVGITEPGGHAAEACRGIDDLLHKAQALSQVPCSGLWSYVFCSSMHRFKFSL